jgi:hypothetical protein
MKLLEVSVMPSLLPHVFWGRSQVSLFFSSVVIPDVTLSWHHLTKSSINILSLISYVQNILRITSHTSSLMRHYSEKSILAKQINNSIYLEIILFSEINLKYVPFMIAWLLLKVKWTVLILWLYLWCIHMTMIRNLNHERRRVHGSCIYYLKTSMYHFKDKSYSIETNNRPELQ